MHPHSHIVKHFPHSSTWPLICLTYKHSNLISTEHN